MSASLFNRLRQESANETDPLTVSEVASTPVERAPEVTGEQAVEQAAPVSTDAAEASILKRPTVTANIPAASTPIQTQKTEINLAIEKILEDDLADVFASMTAEQQLEFKKAGEETVSKIELLLQATKVKVHEIFNLIVVWLKHIPGVNSFFLRQEAKIKTDRVLKLKDPLQ